MLDTILYITVTLLLILVFIQDMKFRAIHILLPIAVFGIGIWLFYRSGKEWLMLMYSVLFLVFTFTGLYFYLMLRNKTLLISINKTMGLGDILFFVAVIPFFSGYNYILFFITGLVFSIISFLIIRLYNKTELVPLAGLLALYIVLLMGINYVVEVDVFFGKLI